jgi:hypothetical protein
MEKWSASLSGPLDWRLVGAQNSNGEFRRTMGYNAGFKCHATKANNVTSCPTAVLCVHMPGFTALRPFILIERFSYYYVIATIVLGRPNNLFGT